MPRNGGIFLLVCTAREKQMPRWDWMCKTFIRNACERKWGRSQGMSLDCDASLTPSEGEREGRKELGVKASYTAVQF